MNPLIDPFELSLVRRVFLGTLSFFVAAIVASILTQVFYPFQTGGYGIMLGMRAAALALNAVALAVTLRVHVSGRLLAFLPEVALGVNFVHSIANVILVGLNQIDAMTSFLVTAIFFVLLFGYFVRNHWYTLFFGTFLYLIAVYIFKWRPDHFFDSRPIHAELLLTTYTTMLFGIATTTILVSFGNAISHSLLRRTREMNAALRDLAFRDQVTKLPNALQMAEDFKSRDAGGAFILYGFKIDGLEALNESLGVERTNLLLAELTDNVSAELAQMKGNGDGDFPHYRKLYRIESNTFMSAAPLRDDHEPGTFYARLLRGTLERLTLGTEAIPPLSFAGGFSSFPSDAITFEQLTRNLLNLLHSKSRENQGRFVGFNHERYRELLRVDALRVDLRQAIADGSITAAYQPKIVLETGRPSGFEVLARWRSDRHGDVSPGEFIPLAEQDGLIDALTRRIFALAFSFIERARSIRDDCHVAVNLSPGVLTAEFLDWLDATLRDNGLAPYVELEITEGILMNVNPVIAARFNALRARDARFAIDDFGTGYSNLGYLQTFEADVLKIDRMFVAGTPANEKNAKLLQAIVQMAHSFNMTVVAEGVEYREQRDYLAGLGCQQIQGYYFSKPLPLAEALAYLRDH